MPPPPEARRREGVAVTGAGVVSPLGYSLAAFDDALFAGRSAVRAQALDLPGIELPPVPVASARVRRRGGGGAVEGAARPGHGDGARRRARRRRRGAPRPGAFDPERLGIFWGSGMAGAATFEATCRTVYAERRRMRPTSVVTTMPNAPVAEIALEFGARGAALGYACACASSAVAIGEAMRAIRAGWIDVAIAGGSESMLTPACSRAGRRCACSCRSARPAATPPRWRRAAGRSPPSATASPSARRRRRSCSSRRARGGARRRGRALLAGYATNCDGVHITQPDASGRRGRCARRSPTPASRRRHRLRQCARHRDDGGRRGRGRVDRPRVRPGRRAGELDQGDPRPPARRRRARSSCSRRCAR
jgi:3-oxoacyl-[acyl-carrier-protein] synthase II